METQRSGRSERPDGERGWPAARSRRKGTGAERDEESAEERRARADITPEIDRAVDEWRASSEVFDGRDPRGPSEPSCWIG
jgi:hypothetical protein